MSNEELLALFEEGRILGDEARQEMDKLLVIPPELWALRLETPANG